MSVTQWDILDYIRKNKERQDITIIELMLEFNMTQPSTNRKIKKLTKYKLIMVTVDGRKKLIGYREGYK